MQHWHAHMKKPNAQVGALLQGWNILQMTLSNRIRESLPSKLCSFIIVDVATAPQHRTVTRKSSTGVLHVCAGGRGVTRLDGTRGKKHVWRPRGWTWALSEANLLYWRKYLWHCWDFSAPPAV